MRVCLIIVLVLSLLSALAATEAESGWLRVTVIDPDSISLQYTNVNCYQASQWITSGQTDSRGEALIRIPEGNYQLKVSLVGFNPMDSIFANVEAGRETRVPPPHA